METDLYCDYVSADYRGGFHLQPVHDTQQERQIVEDVERLRLASQQSGYLPPSRAFTPLLDVPVDNYTSSTLRSRTPSPSPGHSFLITGSPHNTQRGRQSYLSPNRRENETLRYNQASLLSVSDRVDQVPERGRSPVRNSQGRGMREGSPDSIYGRQSRRDGYTEVSVQVPSQRRGRTPLADVFDSHMERSPSSGRGSGLQENGHFQNDQERRGTLPTEEYEITTLIISKAKQSLGKNKLNSYLCTDKNASNIMNMFFKFSYNPGVWYMDKLLIKLNKSASFIYFNWKMSMKISHGDCKNKQKKVEKCKHEQDEQQQANTCNLIQSLLINKATLEQ